MSQSNEPRRSRPSGQAPRRSGTPPVVRQPVGRGGRGGAPQSPLRANIDRTLPPFSVRRYAVIWIAVMVPLVFILLLLLRPNGSAGSSSGAAGKYMVIETAKGRIVAKLRTEPEAKVTKTIANFEQKANAKEFDGRTFHRVEDWVIQGGDPKGDGTGGGNMPSEYNQIPFKTGALGVARGGDPAINNDSQFFIVKSDADSLNGQYTNFGEVTEGMDVVTKIAIGDKITSIRVEDRK